MEEDTNKNNNCEKPKIEKKNKCRTLLALRVTTVVEKSEKFNLQENLIGTRTRRLVDINREK